MDIKEELKRDGASVRISPMSNDSALFIHSLINLTPHPTTLIPTPQHHPPPNRNKLSGEQWAATALGGGLK